MKKFFLWAGLVLLSPILLFTVLTVLLYLPPVQNWAVDRVATMVSRQTGLQIAIDHIDLDFPLDLGVDGLLVVRPTQDTIAKIDRLVAHVELLPLADGKIVVNELMLSNAQVDTYDLISDLQISGKVGHLSTHSRGIDLAEGIVELNTTRLADADISIVLSDTAATDTTQSAQAWLIRADSLVVLRSKAQVRLPGDTTAIAAYLGKAKAADGMIDLMHGIYAVRSFDWSEGWLNYDQTLAPKADGGIDPNHIVLSGIDIGVDSIYYNAPNLALKLRHAAMKEQCGLAVVKASATVLLDSSSIELPKLELATPYSYISGRLSTDFSIADSLRPGLLHANIKAQLGKQDIMTFLDDMPDNFRQRWPQWPLSISGKIDGNLQQADISQMELTLPTAFRAHIDGKLSLGSMSGQLGNTLLNIDAETYDLSFASTLLDRQTAQTLTLPKGMALKGKVGTLAEAYTAELTLRQGNGTAKAKGSFDPRRQNYSANISINRLNLKNFLPKMGIETVTANGSANGHGTDIQHPKTRLKANVSISKLRYGQMDLDSINVTADIANGRLQADIAGCNTLFEGLGSLNARLSDKAVDASLDLDMQMIDLYTLGLTEDSLLAGATGHIDIGSDLKQLHWTRAVLSDLRLRDRHRSYQPENFGLYLRTQPDSTWARIQSGNLIVKIDASGGYEQLLRQANTLARTVSAQIDEKVIDQAALKQLLPNARLHVTSGRENPIAAILRTGYDIDYRDLKIDLTVSPADGINGEALLLALDADSVRIDTIALTIKDSEHGLTYQGRVANNRKNPQFVFTSLFDGNIHKHGANMGLRFYDAKGNMGLRIGAKADMVDEGLRLHLLPKRPNIGYKEFNLNDDNFLLVDKQNRIKAKIDLIADDGTGIKIYTNEIQDNDTVATSGNDGEDDNEALFQDITLSLYRFDLGKISSVLPYVLPEISGTLNGDCHLIMNRQKQLSIASDMQIANLLYEKSPIGNLSSEFVYLQREDNTHAISGTLYLEEREIGSLKGEYQNEGEGRLNADLTLTQFPLMIVNGFVPEKLLGLEGFADGELKVLGEIGTPQVDGEIYLSSAALLSTPYGVRLRFDDDPVRIVNSQLLLENFTMYAYNDEPLNIMGHIDFHQTDRITTDLRMRARNFQLINSKQTKESIAYGKAFVNFYARLQGRIDQLKMQGRVDVLGTTDLTYLLLDSPLSTDNQMNELVKFTDFTDSTQTVVQRPMPDGLDVSMNISIDEGAHMLCGLNSDQSNYIDLFGGGTLRMKYASEGMMLTGRYTISSGEMKYSLPVIPLKNFTLQDGSYVEFTGDPANPRLNITATERTKASVAEEGQPTRSVTFDCGVIITKTLNDMGLQFIIAAPEDMAVQNELNSMTAEQQGKLAVTMLTTGMYLADGNTSGFSMNSALSSFLQSEINNITGNALKTLDLSIGLDNTTDASGQMHTDYSFKFAKRFWNNRLKVQIGGKVSTGNDMYDQGQKQSFFDNVSMEYRLSPTSNQYVKLFYKQNVYDWLEGYTSLYGGGYIWKRKLDNFWDILKIWGSEKRNATMPAASFRRERNDSLKTTSNEGKKE